MQIGAFYTHIWSVLGNVHTLVIRHRHLILGGHNDPTWAFMEPSTLI